MMPYYEDSENRSSDEQFPKDEYDQEPEDPDGIPDD